MFVCVFICFIVQTLYFVNAQFQCIGTCYGGLLNPKKENTLQGKFIKGYSYKNITNTDDKKCYSMCKQDCRCKACQMKDGKCELLDGDVKFCKLHLHDGPGYVFYNLEQTKLQGHSHMIPQNVCYNGCCQSQPCQNGGTCQETCQDPKQKFTCHCKEKYFGKVCQKIVSSCQDIATKPGTSSHGRYTIYRTDTGAALNVYCDFTTPNQAWTLIESFSYRNNEVYRYMGFFFDSPNNTQTDPITWSDYRLPLDTMKYLSSRSTQFRATCKFPSRVGSSLKRDSLLGSLKEYDIINDGVKVGCVTYQYINIRGDEYFNQSALTYHRHEQHFHVEPDGSCDFVVDDKMVGEEFFGVYQPQNTQFSCVESMSATTQWWLGGEIQKCI